MAAWKGVQARRHLRASDNGTVVLPGLPPALTSFQYTQDFSEVKALGSLTGSTRTADQTALAEFWNGKFDTVATIWNRVGDSLAARPDRSLTENARFFALLNVAMADSVIAVWNAKNTYNTWRPLTAIANASIYDKTGASPDPLWRPLLPTPPHQEYPSGHSGVSSSAATVLASFFGNDTSFSASSDGIPPRIHKHRPQLLELLRCHCRDRRRPHRGRLPLPLLVRNRGEHGRRDRRLRPIDANAPSPRRWRLADSNPASDAHTHTPLAVLAHERLGLTE